MPYERRRSSCIALSITIGLLSFAAWGGVALANYALDLLQSL